MDGLISREKLKKELDLMKQKLMSSADFYYNLPKETKIRIEQLDYCIAAVIKAPAEKGE